VLPSCCRAHVASDWALFVVLPDDAPPGIAKPPALRRAAVIAGASTLP